MISNESFEILKMLYAGHPVSCSDAIRPYLSHLKKNGYIDYKFSSRKDEAGRRYIFYENIRITESGRSYVQEAEAMNNSLQGQLSVLREMADTAKKELALHEQQILDAKKESKSAAVRSWIAIGISILAIAASILGAILGAAISAGWIK